ncbi:MAG: manganese-dependent inorganic pyrophosphatase [Methanotrichaceae archaeon]|nr:manganese-dependent inorganic pyrophosphatase [Methanotrichaceae archaeon]
MTDKIYVVGHKSPDTDSVTSAITYANLKKSLGMAEVVAAAAGDINNETKFILDFFKVAYPEKLTDATDKNVILVDHNEMAQAVDNLNEDNILEIVDHHKIGGIKTGKPIYFINEPIGATGGIIANLYDQSGVKIGKEMAGLMMAAILSDTVLFKSPTCTPKDKVAVEKLSQLAGVDPMKFGMEMLKAKSDVASKSAKDILMGDFKKFDFSGVKAAVGQIEVMDLKDLEPKRAGMLDEMNKVRDAENLDMIVLMLTDVMKESSDLLFVGNAQAAASFETAFGGKISNNSIYKEKVLSRKKQVIPPLEGAFKKAAECK